MDFVSYKYIAMLMVLAEIAVILIAYKRDPKLAVYAVLVSIMFKGHYLWIGRAIYAWHIAALLGLIFLAMGCARGMVRCAGRQLELVHSLMLFYFVYTLSISIPMWLLFSAEGLGNIGTQVSFSRVFTQVGYFFLLIGLYGFGLRAGQYLTTVNLLRIIILVAVIAAYGAILQTLVFVFVGINIFPIIGSDDTVRSAFILDHTFRASSFVGEPKHLGILMSIGLISHTLTRLLRIQTGSVLVIHRPLVIVAALILSLSTTGFVLTAAGIGFISLLFFSKLRALDFLILGVLAFVLTTLTDNLSGDFLTSLERQISKSDVEVQDISVREALLANPTLLPTGTGLGNIHLIAVDYLPPNFPLFRDHGYKANSGLFFVMGDSGIIGLLLISLGPLWALYAYAQMKRHMTMEQRNESLAALGLMLMSLMSFLLRYEAGYFLFYGFAFARLAMVRAQSRQRVSTTPSLPLRKKRARFGNAMGHMR